MKTQIIKEFIEYLENRIRYLEASSIGSDSKEDKSKIKNTIDVLKTEIRILMYRL